MSILGAIQGHITGKFPLVFIGPTVSVIEGTIQKSGLELLPEAPFREKILHVIVPQWL